MCLCTASKRLQNWLQEYGGPPKVEHSRTPEKSVKKLRLGWIFLCIAMFSPMGGVPSTKDFEPTRTSGQQVLRLYKGCNTCKVQLENFRVKHLDRETLGLYRPYRRRS